MNTKLHAIAAALTLSLMAQAGTLHYVDLNSTNPTPPYLDWTTAATNIQDAIDAAADGEQILVTNGWYQTGGRVMAGDLTNRVVLDKAVTVQSVNGPWVTTIAGAGATNGTKAVRCAWLTNSASLVGFRVINGATRTSGDLTSLESGGGIWCSSSNATVANCLIVSNIAYLQGGGVFQGTINNSLLSSNALAAGSGTAAWGANLSSCTVVSNTVSGGYAVNLGRLTNCIVYYNSANYQVGTVAYCCIIPVPGSGSGNFITPPQLFADGVHLNSTSPCIGAGTNLTTGTDIFGRTWANPPSVGCAEWQPAPLVTQPQVQLTSDPIGFTVGKELVGGQPGSVGWWIKDGVALQDNGHFTGTQTTNLVATGISFSDAGSYQLVLSNASGMVTSAVAQLVVHCVDAAGTSPAAPYLTWATAATNIQDAITASLPGEVVLVTNGVYATGGKSMDGLLTNRVAVDKAVVVQSVNGASSTIIQGASDPLLTNGPAAVRCVWLASNSVLAGFTLQGGATRETSSGFGPQCNGGGVYGTPANTLPPRPPTSTVANCVLTGNNAGGLGGGSYCVNLNFSTVKGNVCGSDGGGASSCNLKNCVVAQNSAGRNGGGIIGPGLVSNTLLTGNFSYNNGGGAYGGTLVNCTITGNSAGLSLGGSTGAAVYAALVTNCIVWGNVQLNSMYPYTNYYAGTLAFCCTTPLPAGPGNIALDPQLLADGFHISASSPCRGAGTSGVSAGSDIDGQPWANPPSIGCDECQPPPIMAIPPIFQVNGPSRQLSVSAIAAGQPPFVCFWSKDGMPVQDDGHYTNSGTTNLVVQAFGPEDGGGYQVVVSNAFGVATSQVTQVVIHAVDAAAVNPIPPYTSWANAATTIQDAVDGAAAGEIVLVTNGIYASGGRALGDQVTNRVAVVKPLIVTSVNGCWSTVIQGAFDQATNGPAAVRCAWLTNGALLSGFTLRNGATLATGGASTAQSGGGVWCGSAAATVANCFLTNNSAGYYGGGMSGGTLNNSLLVGNQAVAGGGAYSAVLNNCTAFENYAAAAGGSAGAGTYDCPVRNSIVRDNFDSLPFFREDNYAYHAFYNGPGYAYSCSSPLPSGTGNINTDPRFLDLFHITSTSPCRGAGSALYDTGVDMDSESWANPPSIGCDEVVLGNLVGPLWVSLTGPASPLVGHQAFMNGTITGRAAWVGWSFGDGPTITNYGAGAFHTWTNPGDYTVTITAYNTDNPGGVSTSLVEHVSPVLSPQLQAPLVSPGYFVFQFSGQTYANYTVQYATNLTAPVTWQTLKQFFSSAGQTYQVQDPLTLSTRFYRVLAQ